MVAFSRVRASLQSIDRRIFVPPRRCVEPLRDGCGQGAVSPLSKGIFPGVVWWIVFFGAAITTGFTYFFGYQNFGMHVAMTATLAATLVLVVVLIVALDWPFRG